jgi:hypothetical protein
MTAILPLASRRSRFLFDLNVAACLAASEQSLNAQTGQTATFTRASTKYALDTNGALRLVPHSLPAFEWHLDSASGLMVPGISIDSATTNLLVRSSEFNSASWGKTNITVTADNATAPDGTLTADKVAATATTFTVMTQGAVVLATSATYSIFCAQGSGAGEGNAFLLYNSTTATALANAVLDYSTGILTVTTGSGFVRALANGEYRVVLSATSGITSGDTLTCYAGYTGGSVIAGKYANLWGAMLQTGAVVGPYTPTSAATASTAADSLSYPVVPVAGTIYQKYWDVTTGAFVESNTAYTASAAIPFSAGRVYTHTKIASGTQTLATMQAG